MKIYPNPCCQTCDYKFKKENCKYKHIAEEDVHYLDKIVTRKGEKVCTRYSLIAGRRGYL